MTFKRNQEIITPDGYCAFVVLDCDTHILVWLSNANKLPREKRWRTYDKKEFE